MSIINITDRTLSLLARAIPNYPRLTTRLGDKIYSTRDFMIAHNRLPRLPRSCFNDRIHKLINSDEILDPLRAYVTDKEYLKMFVKSVVGEIHVVPSIAVIRNLNDALVYSYPPRCVIKPTH